MLLNIESVELGNKSYKLKAAGKTYYAKINVRGIEQTAGKSIEAVTSQSEFNGRTNIWIEGFTVVSGPAVQQTTSQPTTGFVDRWYMPFVSNVCAHAIEAGLIKHPADLKEWVRFAKQAAESLEDVFEML